MAKFRTREQIILNMLDYLRIVEPELDTKPGTLARELMVDPTATELSKAYAELRNVANQQSIVAATGTELDRLARNYGLSRSGGSRATGVAVFTTNTLDTNISIPQGSIVTARNGVTFKTIADSSFQADRAGVYRANATRLRTSLDLAGISDEYAVEVAVEASTFGSQGNIGIFSLISHSIPAVSNVTNIESFTGGSSTETDQEFRSRVVSVFTGSNTGTQLGYENAVFADPRVIDVLTIGPGDPLMTRDGTDVSTNSAGEKVIVSAGTGGKVDLITQGQELSEFTESYIYEDQSGKNDATDSKNDFVLGQRGVSTALDFQQRRQLLVEQGTLPFQPVDSIVSVSGSLSGPNFTQKYTENGETKGNFELLKDDGSLGGSSFGFDKLHFIANTVKLEDETINKATFNGEDALDFTDVQEIDEVRQQLLISNEHPTVDRSDRSILTLKHTPVVSVDRVVNLTTGQRYVVENQNIDGVTGEQNTTGRVKISGGNTGSSLPATTDILQVNYTWNNIFDDNIDYDDLSESNDFLTTQDSIDWGFSNRVSEEESSVLYSGADGYHLLVDHSIYKVVNVNTRLSESVPNISGKLTVSTTIENITKITDSQGREVYFTALGDGSFSGKEITLPTDTLLNESDLTDLPDGYVYATVIYNEEDIFSPDGYDTGTFNGSTIKLQDDVASVGDTVFVDYVANVNNLVPTTPLSNLPASGSGNRFVVNSNTTGQQPVSNILSGSTIVRNLRFAPSYLRMNVSGISTQGRLTVKGSSFTKITDIITVTSDSLTVDLSNSIKDNLGVSSVPSTVYLAYVSKMERVTLSGGEVSSVDHEFDLLNYNLKTTDYSNGTAIEDSTISKNAFKITGTEDNTDNQPSPGQRLRITYYIVNTNEVENIIVSTAGIRISQNRYVYVDSVSVNSGFQGLSGSIDGTIKIDNFNQPTTGTNYLSTYSYTAPKEGERITISYNYNRLIGDVLFDIEDVRPITADVLVKAASSVSLDVSLEIIALSSFTGNTSTLQQNVQEGVSNFITSTGLGATVDASDLVNAIYSVSGVDRVIITKFNTSGLTGVKKSISADKNQYFTAGIIETSIEER